MFTTRQAEGFGDVELSVQASQFHYCSPRVDHLPLAEYEAVEIALCAKNGPIIRPEGILSEDLCELFESKGDTPVAGWVSQEKLAAIREELRERAQDSEG